MYESSELVFILLDLSFRVHPIGEQLGKTNSRRITLDGSFSLLVFLLFLFLLLILTPMSQTRYVLSCIDTYPPSSGAVPFPSSSSSSAPATSTTASGLFSEEIFWASLPAAIGGVEIIRSTDDTLAAQAEANRRNFRLKHEEPATRAALTRLSAPPKYSAPFLNYARTTGHHVHDKGSRLSVECPGMMWNTVLTSCWDTLRFGL